jgi:DNA-binding CsgD family transcriptional regulator
MAESLNRMAMLELRADRAEGAAVCLRESLQVAGRAGMPLAVDNALNCCGYLCAATGRHLEAVTVWAAADAFRKEFAGAPAEARRRHEAMCETRQVLDPALIRTAEDRGAAMSRSTAAEYALMLTLLNRSATPTPSPGTLSARERELVTLVAQGHTDAQIAAELHISIRTVRSHLDRIRDKTGCRRRADLTRLALSEGLV